MQQMNRERFRKQVCHYRAPTGKTQENLAKVLALNPQVLSHKLHGVRNAHLTHREVQTILKTLVEWGAMKQQAEVRELLELMECPDFPPAEWEIPPLNRLEAVSNMRSMHLHNIRIPIVEYEVRTQGGCAPPSIILEKGEGSASQLPRWDWGEAIDVST